MNKVALFFLVVFASCVVDTVAVAPCERSDECPAELPWCDQEAAGTCRPCQVNAECAGRPEGTVCDTAAGRCVLCLRDTDCDAPLTCTIETNQCTGCQSNAECTSPTASQCNVGTELCESCTSDAGCVGIDGLPACNSGTCSECTVQNETECGAMACNPATNTCSEIMRGSAGVCGACTADSECGDDMGNESSRHRCIALDFMGEPQGGRCLEVFEISCGRPYTTLVNAVSVSGVELTDYCGVRQDLTTCEAVRAGESGGSCPGGDATQCAPEGSRCEMVGLVADQCTYACQFAVECPDDLPDCAGGFCTVP